jgi:hypothetical protein
MGQNSELSTAIKWAQNRVYCHPNDTWKTVAIKYNVRAHFRLFLRYSDMPDGSILKISILYLKKVDGKRIFLFTFVISIWTRRWNCDTKTWSPTVKYCYEICFVVLAYR